MTKPSYESTGRTEGTEFIPSDFTEDQILERTSRSVARLKSPDGETDIEITFRQSKVTVQARAITICEVCVTTIDDQGNRTTVCKAIKCPKSPSPSPPSGPVA